MASVVHVDTRQWTTSRGQPKHRACLDFRQHSLHTYTTASLHTRGGRVHGGPELRVHARSFVHMQDTQTNAVSLY